MALSVAAMMSCKEGEIIGRWRRMDSPMYNRYKVKKLDNSFGDLIFLKGSTFYIKGNSLPDTSHIPGWHAGGDLFGTWYKKDRTHLVLMQNIGGRHNFGYVYKITTLNKHKLILISIFEKKRCFKKHMIYKRL